MWAWQVRLKKGNRLYWTQLKRKTTALLDNIQWISNGRKKRPYQNVTGTCRSVKWAAKSPWSPSSSKVTWWVCLREAPTRPRWGTTCTSWCGGPGLALLGKFGCQIEFTKSRSFLKYILVTAHCQGNRGGWRGARHPSVHAERTRSIQVFQPRVCQALPLCSPCSPSLQVHQAFLALAPWFQEDPGLRSSLRRISSQAENLHRPGNYIPQGCHCWGGTNSGLLECPLKGLNTDRFVESLFSDSFRLPRSPGGAGEGQTAVDTGKHPQSPCREGHLKF